MLSKFILVHHYYICLICMYSCIYSFIYAIVWMCDVMNDALFPRQVSNCTLYDWYYVMLCYLKVLPWILPKMVAMGTFFGARHLHPIHRVKPLVLVLLLFEATLDLRLKFQTYKEVSRCQEKLINKEVLTLNSRWQTHFKIKK